MCQDNIIKFLDVFILTIQDFELLYNYKEKRYVYGNRQTNKRSKGKR